MSQQEHPPESPEYRPAEDEIDLADLAAVLYRNRWMILAGTLLITLLAAGYSWLQPERYEVKSFLAVGKIDQDHIEDPKAVAAQINSLAEITAERRKEKGQDLGFSLENDFEVSIKGGGTIRVGISEAPKAQSSLSFVKDLINQIIEDHRGYTESERESINKQIAFLEDQTQSLAKRKERLVEQIEKVAGQTSQNDSNKLNILNNLLNTIDRDLKKSRQDLYEKQSQLQQIRPTKILVMPDFSTNPVNTNFRLHAALGLVLGAFLSVFAAFLREFWRNNRDRITQDA